MHAPLRALSHPNIAALDEIGGGAWSSRTSSSSSRPATRSRLVVAGRPLNPRRALDYAIQIADALADIHAQGIVHEDLKPDNIVITSKGAAKLLDVGLSRWTAGGAARRQAARRPDRSTRQRPRGTAAYMSPEQALGGPVDHRTDLFSLGVVLFEMLTGKPPFAVGATGGDSAADHAIDGARAERRAIAPFRRELDAVVARMLAKSLEARYQSAATVAADLRSVAVDAWRPERDRRDP